MSVFNLETLGNKWVRPNKNLTQRFTPTLAPNEELWLLCKLIKEEVQEFENAILSYQEEKDKLVEIMDAYGDIRYLNSQIPIILGTQDYVEDVMDEIHRSNESKLVDGEFQYNEFGKVVKPEGYFKPDLKKVIYGEDD